VRNAVIELAHSRADLRAVNVTMGDNELPIHYGVLRMMQQSTFCLITKVLWLLVIGDGIEVLFVCVVYLFSIPRHPLIACSLPSSEVKA
jgi:Na+/H+ antiporter NhaA